MRGEVPLVDMWRAMRHPVRFSPDHRFSAIQALGHLDGDLEAETARRVRDHSHMFPEVRDA